MEKNVITKISSLTEQIKDTYTVLCNSTSQIIRERCFNKLKQQVQEYESLTKQFDKCSKCEGFLDNDYTEKHLGYSCHKGLIIYIYMNKCRNCGKINILKRERIGNCSGKCSPCSFSMDLEFSISNNKTFK